MDFYVLQCRFGSEELVRKKLIYLDKGLAGNIIIPKRRLNIRKRGKLSAKDYKLFPGYIFLKLNGWSMNLYSNCRKITEILRLLPDNNKVAPLGAQEKELIYRLTKKGELISDSKVRFDVNNRIRVVSGALEGLEGNIVKVDRRKKRAQVRLDVYEESFKIDFGFQDIGVHHAFNKG